MKTNITTKEGFARVLIGVQTDVYQVAKVRYQVNGFSDDRECLLSLPDVTINQDNFKDAHFAELIENMIAQLEPHTKPEQITLTNFRKCNLEEIKQEIKF